MGQNVRRIDLPGYTEVQGHGESRRLLLRKRPNSYEEGHTPDCPRDGWVTAKAETPLRRGN